MKKLLLICVTYNSYDSLLSFLQSVDRAAKEASEEIGVDVCIADNSTHIQPIDRSLYMAINVRLYVTSSNLGYLGGVKYVLHKLPAETIGKDYDYLAVSNVDLELAPSFFKQLVSIDCTHIGWIAPSIYSLMEHKERSPRIMTRPSRLRLQLAKLTYLHPLINKMYVKWVYNKRKKSATPPTGTKVYAGHGSFMLFCNPQWVVECIDKYHPFLFCEENFFAEEMTRRALVAIYCEELKIQDADHVSTSAIAPWDYCRYNREAIQFILENYLF